MNRPLIPKFLNKLDRKLLLNKPDTWSTRVHFVVYYSILFILLVAALSFLNFNDARAYSAPETWTSLTALLCFIGLIIWLIYLLRFNVFKRFGKPGTLAGLKTFLLFFVGMFFIVLPSYIPTLVESFMANRQYSSPELVQDINTINKNILQLNQSVIPKKFRVDTVVMVADNDPLLRYNGDAPVVQTLPDVVDSAVAEPTYNDRKNYVNKKEFENRKLQADSLQLLSNTMFLQFTCPVYSFLNVYQLPAHSTEKVLKNMELYHLYVKQKPTEDAKFLQRQLNNLLNKYRVVHSYDYYQSANDDNIELKLKAKYQLYSIENGLNNIVDKKYRWDAENFPVYFRVIFYVSFILTLLLFIFRHSTTKTFFLTILTGVVLFILSAIIIAFGNWEGREVLLLMLIYYAAFLVLCLLIKSAIKRLTSHGIALNMITAFTAFVPLLVLAFLDNWQTYDYTLRDRETYFDYDPYYKYAEIAGILIFVILIQPVFKKAYRKWYALPEH